MSRRKPAIRGLLAGLLGLIALSVAPSVASASTPTIINTGTGCSGQTAWLVTCATGGEGGGAAQVRVSVLASHANAENIASILTDDDWDGTDDPTTVRSITVQRPNIATGYPRTRGEINYGIGNTNIMGCPIIGTRTRKADRT